jgi:hypothetical protein
MIDLASSPHLHAGLILFPDNADPSRWYAAGAEVRPARADALRIDIFRGGAEGALVQLEITADPSPAALEGARAALGDGVVIVPVEWVGGEVWIAGRLGDADVSRSVGRPGTAGSTNTVIAARVDEALARVVVAALQGEATPAVVGYELEAEGLAPPLDAEVEADMGAVYDAFAAQGALLTPIGRARVRFLVEELVKGGAVRVHVSDGAGDETRSAAIARFGEDLVRLAFAPAGTSPIARSFDPAMAQIELQFKLSWRRDAVEQHLRWSYRERKARRFSHFVSASLIGWGAPSAVREHSLDGGPEVLELAAVGRFAEVGVELDAPIGAAFTLLPEAARAEVLLGAGARDALRYRVTTRFETSPLGPVEGPVWSSDWIDAPGALALVLDPAAIHGLWTARFELLAAETGVTGVDLRLFREDGELEARATLVAGAPSLAFSFVTAGWRVARRWQYPGDVVEDEADVLPGFNLLRPPTRTVETRVLVVADEGLEVVDVTLVGEDAPAWRHDLTLTPADDGRTLRLVVAASGPERWRWTATSVYADGRVRVEEGGPRRALVLGAAEGVRAVSVVLLLSPEAQGFAAITLVARAGDAAAHAWLDGGATKRVLTLPAAAPRAWTLTVEGLRADGSTAFATITGDDDIVVLPPFPA